MTTFSSFRILCFRPSTLLTLQAPSYTTNSLSLIHKLIYKHINFSHKLGPEELNFSYCFLLISYHQIHSCKLEFLKSSSHSSVVYVIQPLHQASDFNVLTFTPNLMQCDTIQYNTIPYNFLRNVK